MRPDTGVPGVRRHGLLSGDPATSSTAKVTNKALELAQGAWAKSLDATWACAWNLAV